MIGTGLFDTASRAPAPGAEDIGGGEAAHCTSPEAFTHEELADQIERLQAFLFAGEYLCKTVYNVSWIGALGLSMHQGLNGTQFVMRDDRDLGTKGLEGYLGLGLEYEDNIKAFKDQLADEAETGGRPIVATALRPSRAACEQRMWASMDFWANMASNVLDHSIFDEAETMEDLYTCARFGSMAAASARRPMTYSGAGSRPRLPKSASGNDNWFDYLGHESGGEDSVHDSDGPGWADMADVDGSADDDGRSVKSGPSAGSFKSGRTGLSSKTGLTALSGLGSMRSRASGIRGGRSVTESVGLKRSGSTMYFS